MKLFYSLGASAALVLASSVASADTINFNNGSGTYSAGGVTASVTVTGTGGQGLHYNGVENAIGVGSNNVNGAMGFKQLNFVVIPEFTTAETMTVTFNQEVTLDTVFFRQWENSVLGFGDDVYLDYSGGTSGTGSLFFDDSGLGDGPGVLLDPFNANVSLTAFTLRPSQSGLATQTAVYLHSVDFTVSQVPLPAAAWLFGSALFGLIGVSRRRKTAA